MSVQPDIEKLIRQTKQYEFADGLRDIQLGLFMGSMGALTWLVISPIWIYLIITQRKTGRLQQEEKRSLCMS